MNQPHLYPKDSKMLTLVNREMTSWYWFKIHTCIHESVLFITYWMAPSPVFPLRHIQYLSIFYVGVGGGRGGCSISSSVLVLKNVKDPVLPRMIEFVYFPWFKFSSKNVSKHHVFLGRHYLHRCQSVTALFSDVVVELIPYLLHNWGWKSSPRPSCESCSTENLRFPWHFYCCEDTQWSNATRRSTCRTSPCN